MIIQTPFHDEEMQDAIDDLKHAQDMMNNSSNKWRTDEAIYRIKAAEARIQAIRYERGEAIAQEVNTALQTQQTF